MVPTNEHKSIKISLYTQLCISANLFVSPNSIHLCACGGTIIVCVCVCMYIYIYIYMNNGRILHHISI